jgi:hypothetical protein
MPKTKSSKKESKALAIVSLTVSILALLFTVAAFFILIYDEVTMSTIESSADILEGCQDLGVEEASECLVKHVKQIYYYNDSQIGKELTFEQLKEEGGVCNHYASLYVDAGKKLGFYTEMVVIKTDEETGHAYAVLSNHEGYCVLDAIYSVCFAFP